MCFNVKYILELLRVNIVYISFSYVRKDMSMKSHNHFIVHLLKY